MYQRQVSFSEAISKALQQNYCNFSGRASRSEYWWFYLFNCIVNWAVWIIVGILSGWDMNVISIVVWIVGLALLLPNIGISVRRLHDIGKSGWWLFISFIPLVGAILLIVWFCQNSQMAPNQYGPIPNMVE
ncbi:MAG: DUF805 domain-containing protein [Muribaculaceae bacterium]|nr:DUF805 domain-containing protein [Muribaculaceae bacterium]